MKFLLVALIVIACSCKDSNSSRENRLQGRWQMVSSYADIGDGKASWREADSKNPRIIEFTTAGDYIDDSNNIRQKYVQQDSTHLQIIPVGQQMPFMITIIKLTEDSLELKPNCIEGCGEKYVRVK